MLHLKRQVRFYIPVFFLRTDHRNALHTAAVYTMHSCISSSSMPALRIIETICSLSSRAAHHDRPHPAEMALGTGMILPGALYSLQAFSIAIASAVVCNVTTSFNSFFLMFTQSPLRNIRPSRWQLISYRDP